MKNQTAKFLAAGLVFFTISCNNPSEKNTDQSYEDTTTVEVETVQPENMTSKTTFDVNSLPVVDNNIGDFPFYTVPDWLTTGGYSNERESDFEVFEFFTGESFHQAEGRLSVVHFDSKDGENWSEHKFMKSYMTHFERLGAVKIWEGQSEKSLDAAREIIDKKGNSYVYRSTTQSLQDNQAVYGLKHNGRPIFFAVAANASYGSIVVLQSDDFTQTVDILNAARIQKDLTEKGKAILHINFDTDKATLKADGKELVAEITKALNADKSLHISINGHTDNTGDEKHNLDLSKRRAETVKTELISSGIDANRLSAEGFGQNNPIADNSTEEGKAKNRRVELIKK